MGGSNRPGSLEHYGVKGMHWGVHKKSAPPSPTGRGSEDFRAVSSHAKKIQKGGTRELNTQELRQLVERMKLEQQYSQMVARKSTIEEGHDKVRKILSYGQTLNNAYTIINGPITKAIIKQMKGESN